VSLVVRNSISWLLSAAYYLMQPEFDLCEAETDGCHMSNGFFYDLTLISPDEIQALHCKLTAGAPLKDHRGVVAKLRTNQPIVVAP